MGAIIISSRLMFSLAVSVLAVRDLLMRGADWESSKDLITWALLLCQVLTMACYTVTIMSDPGYVSQGGGLDTETLSEDEKKRHCSDCNVRRGVAMRMGGLQCVAGVRCIIDAGTLRVLCFVFVFACIFALVDTY